MFTQIFMDCTLDIYLSPDTSGHLIFILSSITNLHITGPQFSTHVKYSKEIVILFRLDKIVTNGGSRRCVKKRVKKITKVGSGEPYLPQVRQYSSTFIFPSFMTDRLYKNSAKHENIKIPVALIICD